MTKAELREAHGTPRDFELALWAAWNQNFVSLQELQDADAKYRAEFEAAE